MISWHDLETYSPTPIKQGTHRYAEKAEIMLWLYAIDDGPVRCWDLTTGAPMPDELTETIILSDEYWWQNGGMFDRTVLKHAMPDIYAAMPLERWRDTMVQGLAHGLPGGLDKLGEICNIKHDERKLKSGNSLIHLFCKPRKFSHQISPEDYPDKKERLAAIDAARDAWLGRATRETHPKEWAEFIEYGEKDVEAMRAIHKKLPKWNYPNNKTELALWHRDLEVNDRGVYVDVELAQKSIEAIKRAQETLATRTDALTYGGVDKATRRDALLKNIALEYGVTLPDMSKSTLERRINDPELPASLRELLAVRLESSMTSTSKYQVLINGVSKDHRLRGLSQFCGAARTGRWAARLFQPQNLKRIDIPLVADEMGADPTDEVVQEYIDQGVDAIKSGCADLVFDNVMGLTGNLVRGAMIAAPGHKFCIADLANIEGRVLAWLAGEEWKLKAFRDYDNGIGSDLYKLAYSRSFGVPIDQVTKEQRQIGKTEELALGYLGGVAAFVIMAASFKMDLQGITDAIYSVMDTLPQDTVAESHSFWDWAVKNGKTAGLDHDTFVACDIIKRSWRKAHPATQSLWDGLKVAVPKAIQTPGTTFQVKRIKIRRDGAWLRLQMPSGRQLCYLNPEVSEAGQLSFLGVNPYSRRWERILTHSGKLTENLCQAVARDVLAHNMPAVEQAGYPLIISVHDELITEPVDTDDYTHEDLSRIMAASPPWAEGLPLAAEGFTAYRYRK